VSAWRPALRIARRDLRRNLLGTLLAGLMVALPIAVATAIATVESSTGPGSESSARERLGGADAAARVLPRAPLAVSYEDHGGGWTDLAAQRTPTTEQRPRAAVDLESLLPEGARAEPAPMRRRVPLAVGGSLRGHVLDLDDPLYRGLARLGGGRAPEAPDEVAVGRDTAGALGLLDADGSLEADAALELRDGTTLSVVGLVARGPVGGDDAVLLPRDTLLTGPPGAVPREWLVELPGGTSVDELVALRADLAVQGVALLARDALVHPEHWPELATSEVSTEVDPSALAVAVLVIGFGLVEVVLMVGAAFSVGVRRQLRTLGLLAAAGGDPSALRRVVLARGLVVGLGASAAGAAAGLGAVRLGAPLLQSLDLALWTVEVRWPTLLVIVLLGTLTGVAAAAYPAWATGRMSAVDVLAGRFPRGRRSVQVPRPAVVLVLAGMAGTVLCGWWIAHEFAGSANRDPYAVMGPEPSQVPVVLGALCLLGVLAGSAWLAPWLVHRAARIADRLPLSGRLAVRDASRHRQRTVAAVVGLMVTIAGTVLAGFGVAANTDTGTAGDAEPSRMLSVSLWGEDAAGRSAQAAAVRQVLGEDVPVHDVGELPRVHTTGMAPGVQVVDEAFLRSLGVDGAVLETFRDGGAVLVGGPPYDGDELTVRTSPRDGRGKRVVLPVADAGVHLVEVAGAVISDATAGELGRAARVRALAAFADEPVTYAQLEQLWALGVEAWTSGAEEEPPRALVALGFMGAAGLVTLVAVGIVVALAAAEGRDDAATLAAIGGPPRVRRRVGAAHGVFVGCVGGALGVVLGCLGGATLLQAIDVPGTPVPWVTVGGVVVVVPLLAGAVGWVVTPTRLTLVRRTA
jgi:putative ABC transport system permease protein